VAELNELEADLRALGSRLEVAPPPDPAAMAVAVRSRLEKPVPEVEKPVPGAEKPVPGAEKPVPGAEKPVPGVEKPVPGRRAWPRRVAVAVVVVCAGAALVAFSPQVRDGIVTLLRFAGVEIGQSSHPVPVSTLPAPLPGERVVSLAEARRLAAFDVHVPPALGAPGQVLVSDGTPPRVVSLVYDQARLDQFDGTADFAYFKKVGSPDQVSWEDVNGQPAIWVEGPHAVRYFGRDGERRQQPARLAANTLIWQVGGTTLRLEGDFTQAEALRIASGG
jgi:hypothetical protein